MPQKPREPHLARPPATTQPANARARFMDQCPVQQNPPFLSRSSPNVPNPYNNPQRFDEAMAILPTQNIVRESPSNPNRKKRYVHMTARKGGGYSYPGFEPHFGPRQRKLGGPQLLVAENAANHGKSLTAQN